MYTIYLVVFTAICFFGISLCLRGLDKQTIKIDIIPSNLGKYLYAILQIKL